MDRSQWWARAARPHRRHRGDGRRRQGGGSAAPRAAGPAYVTLPRDVGAARGERYLAYELGPPIEQGQIIVPTGILVVEQPSTDEATLVRIERMFGEVKIGNRFIPLERIQLPTDARPAPVDLGVRSRVIWVASQAVFPRFSTIS